MPNPSFSQISNDLLGILYGGLQHCGWIAETLMRCPMMRSLVAQSLRGSLALTKELRTACEDSFKALLLDLKHLVQSGSCLTIALFRLGYVMPLLLFFSPSAALSTWIILHSVRSTAEKTGSYLRSPDLDRPADSLWHALFKVSWRWPITLARALTCCSPSSVMITARVLDCRVIKIDAYSNTSCDCFYCLRSHWFSWCKRQTWGFRTKRLESG